EHPLGTDHLGRDILSRILHGGRISLGVGLTAVTLSALFGVTLGLLAGFFGGRADALIMRVVDVFLAIPYILLAMGVVFALGPSLLNVILVMAVTRWVQFARIVRADVLSIREREFVAGARARGNRALRLLAVEGLRTQFATSGGTVRAVDGLSFAIERGEVLGLVGESGCGKSVTSLSIMRLVPPPGRVTAGRILLDGDDLLDKDAEAMRRVRGARIAMVFQEPMTSLNPVFTIGDQIAAAVRAHEGGGRRAAWERAVEMLDRVQVPSPRDRARDYPHQLSGGLRQRAMIALP